MVSENAKQVVGKQLIDRVVSEKPITDNISFVCVDKGNCVQPRMNFGVVKNGQYRQTGLQRELNITLKDGITKDNLEEAIANGDAIRFTHEDLVEIGKEIGYLVPVQFSQDAVKKMIEKIYFANDGEFFRKVKNILNDDEKASFKDWERKVGYETVIDPIFNRERKRYNVNNWQIKSATYVVMHSQRLLNAVIYLKESIAPDNLHDVWNYLLCYEHRESFVEVMYFSEWNDNDPDTLLEKYNIKDKIVETEDKSFLRRNDASIRVGEDYKMATQIRVSFDDWDGTAVVVPKSCKLSPLEIISAGESVDYVENNFFVKNQLVRRSPY